MHSSHTQNWIPAIPQFLLIMNAWQFCCCCCCCYVYDRPGRMPAGPDQNWDQNQLIKTNVTSAKNNWTLANRSLVFKPAKTKAPHKLDKTSALAAKSCSANRFIAIIASHFIIIIKQNSNSQWTADAKCIRMGTIPFPIRILFLSLSIFTITYYLKEEEKLNKISKWTVSNLLSIECY